MERDDEKIESSFGMGQVRRFLYRRWFAELSQFSDKAKREHALDEVEKLLVRSTQGGVIGLGVAIVIILIMILSEALNLSPLYTLLLFAASLLMSFIASVTLYRRRVRRLLRRLLNEDGWKLCTHCGYDVRGILSQKCPECGRSIRFRDLRGRKRRNR